ncbi:MAG TPA: Ig-like domain-containing protein [Acidimicrobiales bacterium]|nr:Ig-like domain-containing protein [Acidimicrobiales bacterium]
MTMTDLRPQAPIGFKRVVLVGVDDPQLDSVPPSPAAPLTVADVLAEPALPADGVLPRTRLATAAASVIVLVLLVAGLAWFRFGDAARIAGNAGPLPTVSLAPATDAALSAGDEVVVNVGPGAGIERIDLFVDGDWTGTDTTAPFAPEWEQRSDGTHELKAKLTDSEGRVRYSDAIEVTIKS